MFNKKLIFALIILCIAISSVSASEYNSTDIVNGYEDNGFGAISENISDVLVSDSNECAEITEKGSDALLSGQTVYFDASASTDGVGTISSPYKYLYTSRITSGMTAYFADGVYSYSGSGDILSKTNFIGQSRENTIIRSTVFSFDLTISSNSNLILKDLTFDNGHIVNYGNLEAENVAFKNSVCSYSADSSAFLYFTCGGAIFSDAPTKSNICNLNLKNCYFEDSDARHGGAIAANYTNVVITNCVFSNSLSNRSGGAIYLINSNLTVSKSSFTRNNAKYGGAIYSEKGNIILTDSNFTDSVAYSFGGVIASLLTNMTLDNCIYLNYQSLTDSGGAIYVDRGSVDIYRSSFTNGVADFGGAICVLNANLSVLNSNFENNTANYGGAIFGMYKNIYIYNSNFKSSVAYYGGAICSYLADSITLTNNVFVDSDDMYIFDKSTTKFTRSGNAGLSNIREVNATKFDIGSNVIAPIMNYSPQSQSNIPSYYNSRDYGYVTPVKDQMDGGNCWAFAAIATLEICLKKATGITYDFSEENIKNLMAIYSLVGRSDEYPNDGGFDSMVFSYLTSWLGPIYDGLDVYDDYSALSHIYSPLFHIQNIYFLPVRKDSDDNGAIKKAIMDYGAVAASTYWRTGNHAITLVGWDDNYNAKDYFGNYAKGVWIVKNSWGSDSDDEGYVYMSYEREFRTEASESYHNYLFTFVFNDTESYVRNYQYDINSVNYYQTYETFSNSGVKIKNIFVAQDNEILSAFSTVFKQPTNYEVTVYKGNTLVSTQQGYSPAGYYTIPLKTKTTLSKGDKFTVCIEYLDSGEKFIPLSSAYSFTLGTFPSRVSYINFGSEWHDLYSYYTTPKVACIKAFTTPLNLEEVALSVNEFSTVYVNDELTINFQLSNSLLNRGFITVEINGKTYYASVSSGKATLKLSFNDIGNYALTAQYKNNMYISNTVSFNFNVVQESGEISISAPDLTKYYGSSNRFSIRVTDNGQPVSGAIVNYIRDSNILTVTTNSDGYGYVNINLYPGTYNVRCEYGGKSVNSKITVKSTISVSDLTFNYGSSYFKATFYNTDGSVLSNTQVKFKVGNDVYTATTNSNGVATYYVTKFSVGAYTVTAVNPVNNETKSFRLTVNKATSTVSLTTSQSDGVVTFTASITPYSATGNVIFTVGSNHVNFTRPISDGKATLDLALDNGNYPAYVTYVGDSNVYSSKSSSMTVTVLSTHDIVISAPDLTKYYGSSKQFSVRVTDNGLPIADERVIVYQGSTMYFRTTDSNGYVYIDIDLAPDTYDVRSEYDGKSVISKITVKSTISVSDLTYDYGNSNLKATFYNTDGSVLSNTPVKFKVGTTVYTATTNSNGVATYGIKLNVGTYNVTAINPINNEEKSFMLTVKKATPVLTLTKVEIDGKVAVRASLSETSATGNIIFTFEGDDYPTGIGEGVSNLIINEDKGTFTVKVKYSGDTNLYAVSGSITVTINKYSTTLYVNDLTKVYGDSKQLVITVKDNNGNPVSGDYVAIDVSDYNTGDYTAYSRSTNSKGQIKFNCNFKPGRYTVDIADEYDYDYVYVVVKKAASKLVASNKAFKVKAKTKKYTIVLKNNKNKVMKNQKVTIKVNGKTYAAKTNKYGKATFNFKKLTKRGTFRAVVTYAGNAYYKKVSKVVKIYVK